MQLQYCVWIGLLIDRNRPPYDIRDAHSGGCYSFATVAAVEGVVAADEGVLNQVSDEQILDCDANNNGCGGGDPQVCPLSAVGCCLMDAYPSLAPTKTTRPY